MKKLLMLCLLVFGCSMADPDLEEISESAECKVVTREDRKFLVCASVRGLAVAPLDSCK